ncbi:organic hydroperoxide resistance protein [Salinactinospora qingdaonensis]|uniref:Organic hydroperoxide resistance protein n=1 Tax=Salinactinospora qingdaonensis TaxID=702744 RepID=A0ABP7GCA7_9ACTN
MTPHYTAVATANGREGRAVSSDGHLDIALATPQELGGSGNASNPEQLFAAGYAACFASALSAVGRHSGHDTSQVSVTAEVGIGGDAKTGFTLSVVLRIELPDDLHGPEGEKLVEHAHQVCPYSHATRGNIPVEMVIE